MPVQAKREHTFDHDCEFEKSHSDTHEHDRLHELDVVLAHQLEVQRFLLAEIEKERKGLLGVAGEDPSFTFAPEQPEEPEPPEEAEEAIGPTKAETEEALRGSEPHKTDE